MGGRDREVEISPLASLGRNDGSGIGVGMEYRGRVNGIYAALGGAWGKGEGV